MFGFEKTQDPEKSWYRVRNHLLKKYPELWHYDLEYKAGEENCLFRRIMFIAGISEKRLRSEVDEALRPAQKAIRPMHYF
ncbi:MAG: hypothetical protein ACOC10_06150 [Bacteroidota bacterium]